MRINKSRLIRLNRNISWLLFLVAAATIISGYALTRHFFERGSMIDIHFQVEWLFMGLLAFHVIIGVKIVRFNVKKALTLSRQGKSQSFIILILIQRLTGYMILMFTAIVVASGLSWKHQWINDYIPFIHHLDYDIHLSVSLIIHVGVSVKLRLTRAGWKKWKSTVAALAGSLLLSSGLYYLEFLA